MVIAFLFEAPTNYMDVTRNEMQKHNMADAEGMVMRSLKIINSLCGFSRGPPLVVLPSKTDDTF